VVRESVAHKVFCDTGGWIFVLAKKLRDFSESLSGLGAGTGAPARLNSAVLKAGLREVCHRGPSRNSSPVFQVDSEAAEVVAQVLVETGVVQLSNESHCLLRTLRAIRSCRRSNAVGRIF
jgi:hypothetical protein